MPDTFFAFPQIEELVAQFPGWDVVAEYAVVYAVFGLICYLLVRFAIGRLIGRQAGRVAADVVLPPGPARDRTIADQRARLDRVEATLLRVVKWIVIYAMIMLAFADLFPAFDTAGNSITLFIVVATGLGLAGAIQPYVRDIIGGSLIFFENTYAGGDDVRIAGIDGRVEELHIRRTVIRSRDGAVHTIPNGAIGVSTNFSRVWATTTVEIVLAHEVDLDRAIEVGDAVGAALAADPQWSGRIIEAPSVSRVSDVSPEGVTIRLTGRVLAGEAGAVAGELRRRYHHEVRTAGIPLARRHDAVTVGGSDAHPGGTHTGGTHPGGAAASSPAPPEGIPTARPVDELDRRNMSPTSPRPGDPLR